MNRSREFFVPPIHLDRTSPVPMNRQIYRQIASAIGSGAIQGEARLPSTRVMAKLLDVSRNTVLAAYDDLAADNLVQGERGAGMRVVANGTAQPRGLARLGLQHVIRASGYPARVLALEDPDGNPFYIRH